jgi:hypothetical protein
MVELLEFEGGQIYGEENLEVKGYAGAVGSGNKCAVLRIAVNRAGENINPELERLWNNPSNGGRGHQIACANVGPHQNEEPSSVSGVFVVFGRTFLPLIGNTGVDVIALRTLNGIQSIELK